MVTRRWLAAPVALCVLAVAGPSAMAMLADMPLPVMVQQSDLIAQVSLVKAGQPAEQELRPPELNWTGQPLPADQLKPVRKHFRTDTVKIEKLYRDTTGKLKVGDVVSLTTPAKDPQAAQPPFVVANGAFYPVLNAGESYVVLVRSMGPEQGYYLPAYPKNITPAGQLAQRLGPKAADVFDVEKWNWGKAEAGLQAAVIVHEPILALTGRTRQGTRVTSVQIIMAVRNASDKPITLTADSDLKPLAVTITTADGRPIKDQPALYANVTPGEPRSKPPITVAPGQVVLVSEVGPSAWYSHLQTTLPAGKFKLSVAYAVEKAKLPAPAEGAPALWSGKVESAPAEFEVKINPYEKPVGPT